MYSSWTRVICCKRNFFVEFKSKTTSQVMVIVQTKRRMLRNVTFPPFCSFGVPHGPPTFRLQTTVQRYPRAAFTRSAGVLLVSHFSYCMPFPLLVAFPLGLMCWLRRIPKLLLLPLLQVKILYRRARKAVILTRLLSVREGIQRNHLKEADIIP